MAACVPDERGDCTVAPTFDFGVRLGLVFVVEAAGLSALTVTSLLAYIVYSTSKIKTNASRKWTTATHIHWYFLSLLVSEIVQAIGGIIDAKWVRDGVVTEGTICTTQGVLKQAGDVGVAFASLAIALHTFFALVFRWRPATTNRMPFFVLGFIWIFLILLVSISLGTHRGTDYYGDTQYWCWITAEYPVQRILLEYLWLWITAFLNFVLYTLIAVVVYRDRSLVICDWRVRMVKNSEHSRSVPKWEKRLALKMLVYPAAYTVTVLPIAVTRWLGFTGHQVPWAATVFADVVFASSGYLNVILFTVTRPRLLPDRTDGKEHASSMAQNMSATSPMSPSTYHNRTTMDTAEVQTSPTYSANPPMNPFKLHYEESHMETSSTKMIFSPIPPGI
ncbi:hypothetical protein BC835DRAFT_1286036 [Cytidiella melzeri]|nr:hypothetical protein BC835DRAFT_1286036 [Cytidiella melzeri]